MGYIFLVLRPKKATYESRLLKKYGRASYWVIDGYIFLPNNSSWAVFFWHGFCITNPCWANPNWRCLWPTWSSISKRHRLVRESVGLDVSLFGHPGVNKRRKRKWSRCGWCSRTGPRQTGLKKGCDSLGLGLDRVFKYSMNWGSSTTTGFGATWAGIL